MNQNVLCPFTLLLRKVGSYNREFAKKWAKDLQGAVGRDGERFDQKRAQKMMRDGTKAYLLIVFFCFLCCFFTLPS